MFLNVVFDPTIGCLQKLSYKYWKYKLTLLLIRWLVRIARNQKIPLMLGRETEFLIQGLVHFKEVSYGIVEW